MSDLVKITEKHHIAETLKKIASTEGITAVTWDKDDGLWVDFAFAVDNSNSLVLIAKHGDDPIPPITLGMLAINSIELDLDYGDLTIHYSPDAFQDSYNSPKSKFLSKYVASLSSAQEIHLSIQRRYRFENVAAAQNYKSSMTPTPSDF